MKKNKLSKIKKLTDDLSLVELKEIGNHIASLIDIKKDENEEVYGILAGRLLFLPSQKKSKK